MEFHHDDHQHPFIQILNNKKSSQFEVPDIGETETNVFFRIQLILTDSDGAFRFNVSNIACYINMRMSPNGMAFDPEKTPPKQVARKCLAECLAFMWETCTTPDGNLKVLEEAEDLEEDLETMKENFEEILKFSDEDLGVKMGTRKDVQAFVEHWYEYISEATDKQEEEDENVTAKGKV